ncbi:hypothetical protein LGR64_11505 [Delftia sp. Lp-1]|uniref:hypothetical protein n=1 Tax=Delftia sp. Lp-1 TaxID=682863 RepID=UPI001E3958BE|nr:hypothetical protein [Delftia sp. Lp-1]MCB4786903.1 hypothetical protein [Delftia sp. Lp-1]
MWLTLQLAPEHANPFFRAMSICRQLELFFLKLHGLKTPNLIKVEQRIVRLLFLDLFEQQLTVFSSAFFLSSKIHLQISLFLANLGLVANFSHQQTWSQKS